MPAHAVLQGKIIGSESCLCSFFEFWLARCDDATRSSRKRHNISDVSLIQGGDMSLPTGARQWYILHWILRHMINKMLKIFLI